MNLSLYPTGLLYSCDQRLNVTKYDIHIIEESHLIQQFNPVKMSVYKPPCGWTRSNEPEDHLDDIAEHLISHSCGSRILCFSYKDASLAQRIARLQTDICVDILVDPDVGLIRSWPEEISAESICDFLDGLSTEYNLFIMRHYLEHYCLPKVLLASLASFLAKTKSLFYLELPDCSKFFNQGNPLFAWEQHRSYFTSYSINELLLQAQFHILSLQLYGQSIEPSICIVAKSALESKVSSPSSAIDYSLTSQRSNLLNLLNHSFNGYISSWTRYLSTKSSPRFLYGIGHNSDRFIQLTNSCNQFDRFVDTSPEKQGFYLASSACPISSTIDCDSSEPCEIILGVHHRSAYKVAQNLKSQFVNSTLFTIFESTPMPLEM